ncbi:DUF5723 family protein [Alistipes sp.]|uniref:DUF5723 family protein n=1 Tax=Alistipes sp. TaxID=1872444 RepID=UPI003A8593E1
MKKTYLLLASLLLTTALAAQNPTAYFMEGSTMRSQFNPAFAPLRGYINIPVLGGTDLSLNGNIALDNILFPRNGRLVTLLDSSVSSAEALGTLKKNNLLGIDTRINILGFGKFTKNHKNFWSFDVALRLNEDTNLPLSLFEFLKRGQEGSIANFGVSTESYLEAGFNYSFPLLNDRLYIGVRGKFLAGLARASVHYDQFDVSLQQDRWAVATRGTMDITADGTTVSPNPETGTFEVNDLNFKPRKPAGYGFAVDLGATYDILPNLQASLAVTDLGFINWSKKSTVSGVSTQQTEFTGVTIPDNGSDPTPDFDLEMLKFNQVESQNLSRMLRASINAGVEYEVWRHRVGIGLLYTARFWEYTTMHNLTGSVNFHPVRWFTLTGSYSFLHNRGSAVGLGLNLCPGWINFFLATDLLVTRHTPQWVPVSQSAANVTLGIGIPLGRRSHRIAAYVREGDRK